MFMCVSPVSVVGHVDSCVLISSAGNVVSVVFAYSYAAVYYNLERIAHPLLVCAEHNAVKDLIKTLIVVCSVKLPATDYCVLFYTHSRR